MYVRQNIYCLCILCNTKYSIFCSRMLMYAVNNYNSRTTSENCIEVTFECAQSKTKERTTLLNVITFIEAFVHCKCKAQRNVK